MANALEDNSDHIVDMFFENVECGDLDGAVYSNLAQIDYGENNAAFTASL